MDQRVMLAVTSLLSILFLTFHLADDIVRGFEPGRIATLTGVVILVVWLYATLVLVGRRSGYVILLLLSILGSVVPVIHMRGAGLVGGVSCTAAVNHGEGVTVYEAVYGAAHEQVPPDTANPLPLILPGVLAGAITAFAAGLGEFGAVITFASNIPGETRTLPLALYTAIQSPDGDALAARLALLSLTLGLAGLLVSEWLARHLRRRLGR